MSDCACSTIDTNVLRKKEDMIVFRYEEAFQYSEFKKFILDAAAEF